MRDSHPAGILKLGYSNSGTLQLKQQERAITVDWISTLESHGMHSMTPKKTPPHHKDREESFSGVFIARV